MFDLPFDFAEGRLNLAAATVEFAQTSDVSSARRVDSQSQSQSQSQRPSSSTASPEGCAPPRAVRLLVWDPSVDPSDHGTALTEFAVLCIPLVLACALWEVPSL